MLPKNTKNKKRILIGKSKGKYTLNTLNFARETIGGSSFYKLKVGDCAFTDTDNFISMVYGSKLPFTILGAYEKTYSGYKFRYELIEKKISFCKMAILRATNFIFGVNFSVSNSYYKIEFLPEKGTALSVRTVKNKSLKFLSFHDLEEIPKTTFVVGVGSLSESVGVISKIMFVFDRANEESKTLFERVRTTAGQYLSVKTSTGGKIAKLAERSDLKNLEFFRLGDKTFVSIGDDENFTKDENFPVSFSSCKGLDCFIIVTSKKILVYSFPTSDSWTKFEQNETGAKKTDSMKSWGNLLNDKNQFSMLTLTTVSDAYIDQFGKKTPNIVDITQNSLCLDTSEISGNIGFVESTESDPTSFRNKIYSLTKCHSSCLTCSGTLSTNCLTCLTSRALSENFSCELKCDESCEKCNEKECVTCKEGLLLIESEDDLNKCVEPRNCPKGTFPDISSKKCGPCEESCDTCSGSGFDHCLSCAKDIFLFEGQCHSQCPEKTVGKEGRCLPCIVEDCLECSSEDKCIICDSKSEKKFIDLEKHICLTSCNQGQYISVFKHENGNLPGCSKCIEKCEKCSASESCKLCNEGFFFFDKKCRTSCPVGYQKNSNEDEKRCIKCDIENCEECVAENKCSSCFKGFKEKNSICVEEKEDQPTGPPPPGNFNPPTIPNNGCSENCSDCSSLSQCTQCKEGFYIDWSDNLKNSCKKCKTGCKECQDDGTCKQCFGALHLVGNECIEKCPSGHFLSEKNSLKSCEKCSTECKECSKFQECSECGEAYQLTGEKRCKKVCDDGFAWVKTNNCEKCDGCKFCLDESKACLFYLNFEISQIPFEDTFGKEIDVGVKVRFEFNDESEEEFEMSKLRGKEFEEGVLKVKVKELEVKEQKIYWSTGGDLIIGLLFDKPSEGLKEGSFDLEITGNGKVLKEEEKETTQEETTQEEEQTQEKEKESVYILKNQMKPLKIKLQKKAEKEKINTATSTGKGVQVGQMNYLGFG